MHFSVRFKAIQEWPSTPKVIPISLHFFGQLSLEWVCSCRFCVRESGISGWEAASRCCCWRPAGWKVFVQTKEGKEEACAFEPSCMFVSCANLLLRQIHMRGFVFAERGPLGRPPCSRRVEVRRAPAVRPRVCIPGLQTAQSGFSIRYYSHRNARQKKNHQSCRGDIGVRAEMIHWIDRV